MAGDPGGVPQLFPVSVSIVGVKVTSLGSTTYERSAPCSPLDEPNSQTCSLTGQVKGICVPLNWVVGTLCGEMAVSTPPEKQQLWKVPPMIALKNIVSWGMTNS